MKSERVVNICCNGDGCVSSRYCLRYWGSHSEHKPESWRVHILRECVNFIPAWEEEKKEEVKEKLLYENY